MILLVFEGANLEPHVMATLKELYFPGEVNTIQCSFGTDTYTLWKEVMAHSQNGYEVDTFNIIKQYLIAKGDNSLVNYSSYQFEAIYLFFDYDPQNSTISSDTLNNAVRQMCNVFSDAMEQGKIFVSYPMFEALFCENSLPDANYLHYVVPLKYCKGFKGWCHDKYYYASHPLELLFRTNNYNVITEEITEQRRNELLERWKELIIMNAQKANFICNGVDVVPKEELGISQGAIFEHELKDYVNSSSVVSILSSFPLFLYDYFYRI